MSIFYITGKPRGGKSYLAVEALYKELCDVIAGRLIVTNIPLCWDDRETEIKVQPRSWEKFIWFIYGRFVGRARPGVRLVPKTLLGIASWLQKDVPNLNLGREKRRVRVLTDQETGEFWCYEPGWEFQNRKKIKINRRGTEIEVPDFTYADGSARGDTSKDNPGTFYVIDEVHIFFPSRAWQRTGEDCTYFLSQHGKMKCDVCMVTQHVDQCDKALRRLAQEYMTVRNLSREPIMGFRLGSLFRFNRMLNSPTSANPYIFDSGFKTMDFDKYGSMYDTSAGVGITGSMVPNVEKRGRSLWWLLIPAVGFVLFWLNFNRLAHGFQHIISGSLNHMVPGMQMKMAGAMNIPTNAVASGLAGRGGGLVNPPLSGQGGGNSDVVAGNGLTYSRPVFAEKPKIWPDWNLEGDTNIIVTGISLTVYPRNPPLYIFKIFLSNTRELPFDEVARISPYCVFLKSGEKLRVASPRDIEKQKAALENTSRDEFGARSRVVEMVSPSSMNLPRVPGRAPPVVMSLPAAGVALPPQEDVPPSP